MTENQKYKIEKMIFSKKKCSETNIFLAYFQIRL